MLLKFQTCCYQRKDIIKVILPRKLFQLSANNIDRQNNRCVDISLSKSNASSLGTHLTFDLGGQLRFGPDLEWLDIKEPKI